MDIEYEKIANSNGKGPHFDEQTSWQALYRYQCCFFETTKERSQIIPISDETQDNYDIIKRAISNTFEQQINTFQQLLGNKGFGKESAVAWAVQNCNYKDEILYIQVDSIIFNKEKKILHEIQCQIQDQSKGEQVATEKNIYSRLMEYFDKKKIVLYIRNADIFANEKRQVFLYSLQDHINSFAKNVLVAFSSNNIFFSSFLERRVKSRFSFKQIPFYDYPFENGQLKILEETFSRNTNDIEINAMVRDCLRRKEIMNFLKKYHDNKFGIKWFLELFNCMLCFMNHTELMNALNQNILTEYMLENLEKAKNTFIFDFESTALDNLPMPCRLVLSALWNMDSRRTGNIRFGNIMNEIQVIRRISGRGILNFSEKILKECLYHLYELQFVNLDKIPITPETCMVLKVNPLKIEETFRKGDSQLNFLFKN